jgi:hypothetical protein
MHILTVNQFLSSFFLQLYLLIALHNSEIQFDIAEVLDF